MNAGEQMPNGPAQSQQREVNKQQVLLQEAQKKDPDGTAASTGHGTSRSGMVLPDLEKALDALFKAQDHLNKAADRSGDGLSKMIDGIGRSLRGLQRELSQVIYRLDNSR
jgi:hypothetical protein